MERPWSLYNKVDKLQIDDLTVAEIKTIMLSISAARLPEWYTCQAGDPHWRPLSSVSFSTLPTAASPESRRPMFEDAPTDLSKESTLAIESVATEERRSARRYKRQVLFAIDLSPTQSFKCETHDISMNGASLKQPFPDWVPKTFRAKMQLGPDKVRVHCKRIGENQLKILEAEPWEIIRQWIVNG